jgi:hypothetical protein
MSPIPNALIKATDVGTEGGFVNLKITNDLTNPSYKINITADVAWLADSTMPPKLIRFRNVDVTPDLTVGAADGTSGLDTGPDSEVANEIYALWLAEKSDGSTIIGLFSTNFTSPTTPTDYDYTLLVGGIRNGNTDANLDPQGQGNLQRIYQVGNIVQCIDSHRILNSTKITTTDWTGIDLTNVLGGNEEIVPISICDLVEITAVMQHDTNGTSLWLSGDPKRVNGAGGIYAGEVDADSHISVVKTLVPITSNNIYYRAGAAVATAPDVTLYVTGWVLSI